MTIFFSPFKKIILLIILTTCSFLVNAQVDKVKEKSKNDTQSNRSNDGYSGSGSGIFFFIDVVNFFPLMIDAHKDMIERKEAEPWLVGLDLSLNGAYNSDNTTTLLLPSIRGNWGLFSTQMRWNNLQDNTGSFKTFDWQIIQFNVVATPNANFRIGTGISVIKETSETVNEHFMGLDLHFKERKINPTMEFRWSENYDTNSKPRFEFNIGSEFNIATYGRLDLNVMAGYLYQKYYSDISFHLIRTGINIHIY
jgi:hypothetical protein